VRAALESPSPSCLRVLELLLASSESDARAAGEALSVWADSGIARLGFGDGENAHIAVQRPLTTIKARGLSLPTPGIARADYDQAERLGVATLKLIRSAESPGAGGERDADPDPVLPARPVPDARHRRPRRRAADRPGV
jgi:hypothetical protein